MLPEIGEMLVKVDTWQSLGLMIRWFVPESYSCKYLHSLKGLTVKAYSISMVIQTATKSVYPQGVQEPLPCKY